MRLIAIISLFLITQPVNASVKIRIFSDSRPEMAFFTVRSGTYEAELYNEEKLILRKGETVLISRYNGRLAFKARNRHGYVIDSVSLNGITGADQFSVSTNTGIQISRNYSGGLFCKPDFGTILMVNSCDEEEYVAAVVQAEGGTGRNIEYFKTQAVIVRTYLYKYSGKHLQDGFNLCDNTHCQVYNGICTENTIIKATIDTKSLVIVDKDSSLIISAFHSNCGGKTSQSEDVWLTSIPYLRKVDDPYCSDSRSSSWQKKISSREWIKIITGAGYKGTTDNLAAFRFINSSRAANYKTGSFSIPFTTLRSELDLRSAFFSVIPDGDSLILKGRGYGHGVGLCQEGAMVMASKGFNFKQIIEFYYPGVIITQKN